MNDNRQPPIHDLMFGAFLAWTYFLGAAWSLPYRMFGTPPRRCKE